MAVAVSGVTMGWVGKSRVMVSAAVLELPGIIDSNKVKGAKSEMSTFCTALELFRMDVGSYPTDDQGLQALITAPADATNWSGPYLKQTTTFKDPWGTPYQYHTRVNQTTGATEFLVVSYGSDKKAGGTGYAADFGSNGVTDPEGWQSGGSGIAGG